MISFAQNYEDIILDRIFKNKNEGIFVDVGANDPIENNLTYHFYLKGWKGINFEPNQFYYKKLLETRPNDINLDFGCSEKEEILEFKEFVNTGLSTFSDEFNYILDGKEIEVIKHQLKCVPIKNVFESKNITNIDFMSVDVEGFELNVLKGNDWDKYRPKVIVLEGIAPTRQDIITYTNFQPFLENVGYKLRYFDGLNVFFTDNKNTNIPDSCFYPPNCFDEFKKHSDILEQGKSDWTDLYVDGKLPETTFNKLLKLRTKDLIKIFLRRKLKKF